MYHGMRASLRRTGKPLLLEPRSADRLVRVQANAAGLCETEDLDALRDLNDEGTWPMQSSSWSWH